MSVYRPRNSPYYHYDFWAGGRRFSGSCRTASRREAQRIEDDVREKVKAAARAARVDGTRLSVIFQRFNEEVGQHDKGADTTDARLRILLLGLTHLAGERLALAGIDEALLARYVAKRRGEKTRHGRFPAPATINRELQLLRRVFYRAVRIWKLSVAVPNFGALFLTEPDGRATTMSREREAQLFAAIRADYRAAARFLQLSGLRRGNVFPLHPRQVDLEAGFVVVHLKSKQPGGRVHAVPLTEPMRAILAAELGRHPDAVFTYVARTTRQGRVRGRRYPITAETFYDELKRAAVAIGWPELTVHDLRHVAATRTLAASGNLRLAQEQLGHTRISTTERYAHVDVAALRVAMALAHGSPGDETATSTPAKSPEGESIDRQNPALAAASGKAANRS